MGDKPELRHEIGSAVIVLTENDGQNWCRICKDRAAELWTVHHAHGGWSKFCRDCVCECAGLFMWAVGRGWRKEPPEAGREEPTP